MKRHIDLGVSCVLAILFAAAGCGGRGGSSASRAPVARYQVATPPAPRRLMAYDFGAAAPWTGFAAVPGAAEVSVSGGARFATADGQDADFPDPLVGDFAAADDMTVTVTGLGRGVYRAAVIAQNVERGLVPARDFQISANGRAVIDATITPEWFYGEEGFFRGVQFDDLPDSPYWDRYIEPLTPWREFTFDSRGELVLHLVNCRIYALVIAPERDVDAREFRAYIEATQAARKAYFLFNKFSFAAAPATGKTPAARTLEDRGYVVFRRHWGRDVTYNTLPEASEVTSILSAAGTPAERVPVTFSVRTARALGDVSVAVSDLSAAGGKVIPSSRVAVESVRYMLLPAARGAYEIRPETIQPQEVNLPAGVTKTWWLTVSIPETAEPGTYTGQVRIVPAGAAGTVLTLSLEVYPFRLVKPAASLGVWYQDPLTMSYHTDLFGGVNVLKGRPESYRPTDLDKRAERYRVAMLEADLKGLSERGFNGIAVPMPRVRNVSPAGRVTLDFGLLDAYPELLGRYGINTDFPGQGYLLDLASQISGVGTSGAPIEEFSVLHDKAYKDAVTQVRDWWRAGDARMLAHVVDEPREKDVEPWSRNQSATLHYLKLVGEVGGLPSTVTTTRDSQDATSYTSILEAEDVVQPRPSVHNRISIEYALASGKPLRFYNGGGFERYDFGFYVWARKPEGFWQWHYSFREFSFNPFWDSHHGYAVYPSPGGPVPTIRYERAAQGIYDYRYALTLEEYIQRAKSSYNSRAIEAAREGQVLLGQIRRGCPEWLLDKRERHVAVPNHRLNLWRARIAERIKDIAEALD